MQPLQNTVMVIEVIVKLSECLADHLQLSFHDFYLTSPTIMVDCHPILDMLFLCYPTMFGTSSPEIISKISTFQSMATM